jgi:CHAD domain-containing protein
MKGFIFPQNLTSATFFRSSGKIFTVRKLHQVQQKRILLDTFDGRLYRRGYVLLKSGAEYALLLCKSPGKERRGVCRSRKIIRFGHDLPVGIVQKKVTLISDTRALLPQVRWQEQRIDFNLINRRKQTVAQGQLVELQSLKHRLLYVNLTSERGHSGEMRAFLNLITEWGGEAVSRSPYPLFLERMNLNLVGYAPKRVLRLQPHWPVYRALQTILEYQTRIMIQNERGLRQDWDVEFLHDFRVAIRRTRSILSQFKNAFLPDVLQRARQDFSTLSELTNPLRDLDVQLQRRPLYNKLLPPSLHPGLEKLDKFITKERQKEFSVFLKSLNGAVYRRIKKEWAVLLKNEDQETWKSLAAAQLPVKSLVCKLVMKKFKQMQKMEQKDWKTADDETLHRLRIEGKKLRYLLEFFASLFPPQELSRILEQLKQLQDHLGRLNDLAVQQVKLLNHLQRKSSILHHPQTTAAIGALVAILHQEQTQLRDNLSNTIQPFFAPNHKKQYKKLFLSRLK